MGRSGPDCTGLVGGGGGSWVQRFRGGLQLSYVGRRGETMKRGN